MAWRVWSINVVLMALAAGPAAGGAAGGAEHVQLRRRLDAIESRIQVLEAPTGSRWLTNRRAREIRTLVSDVLADADTRVALRDDPMTAGWDDEFFIESADGRFRVEVSGQVQVRYTWNRRQRPTGDDTRSGFEVRRAKIKLNGHVLWPQLNYTVGTALVRATGTFGLQSFNIRYRLSDELTVALGRARPPLLREESVSSKRQLAADRSLVARTFRQTRTLGVMLSYRSDALRIRVGFMDATTATQDDPDDPPMDFDSERWRASARADLLLAGRWKRLEDFTSFPEDEPVVAVGAGVLFEDDEPFDPAENDSQLLRWSADVSVELGGANMFASVVGSHFDEQTRTTLDQYGMVVQGGLFITEHWELFARYEYGDAGGVAEELSVLTAGVNRYVDEHQIKWTADIGYGFNPVDDFWSSRGAGWLDDRSDENGQIVMRMQMQLLF